MIPEFPEFKKIELSDKEDIEKFTSAYPPYSDFNFVSMWSWDIRGEMRISQLNNNLVVRFTDYLTGEPFYSFLGENDINETIKTLISFAKKEGINPSLKLIPGIIIDNIDAKIFEIEEDRDNFDYILSIDKLKPHDGSQRKLSNRRKLINKLKNSGIFTVKVIDIQQPEISEQILKVSVEWEKQRGISEDNAQHLYRALKKSLQFSHKHTFSIGAFIENKLVGYSINEIINTEYALGNFQQADLNSSNVVYALLMQEAAILLSEFGCKYINLEQDLGIEGLKKWKASYDPVFFLKKYTISVKQ